MQKGFTAILNSALGIVVLVILMSAVVIPQIFAPVNPSTTQTAVTNSTATAILSSGTAQQTFILSNPDRTTTTASAVVTYQFNGTGASAKINLTTPTGTYITTLDGTSPDTISLAQATYLTDGVNKFNWTSSKAYEGSNITSVILSYNTASQSVTQGWDAQTIVIWTVLALGCVIATLLFIFKMAG
jgi:hypothetical protein